MSSFFGLGSSSSRSKQNTIDPKVIQFQKQMNEMGMNFDYNQILSVLNQTKGNQEQALDILLNSQSQQQVQPQQTYQQNGSPYGQPSSQSPSSYVNPKKNQNQNNQQMANGQGFNSYEPIPTNERARDGEIPSGLKNVGNTCYFGSLIQCLFFLPNIQQKILRYDSNGQFENLKNMDESKMDPTERIKLKQSQELIVNMQKLFAEMLISNVKYQDPTKVLESIVDDNGHKIEIYLQADICEFFLNFLDRLQDGLGENKAMIRKMMGNELLLDMAKDGDGKVDMDAINVSFASTIDTENQINGNGNLFEDNQESDKNSHNNKENGESVNLGSVHPAQSMLDSNVNNIDKIKRQQSIYDPSQGDALLNYDLDAFKNSIWENFLGSQVQISKLVENDGSYKITNKNVNKMGPIQLQIENENLYSAWEQSRKSMIDEYEGKQDGQTKILETWVCRPPNVMMFQLNRVDYDRKQQKSVKDNSRFDFDKTIYLDLFLNCNKQKAEKHDQDINKKRNDLKVMKEAYSKYTEAGSKGQQQQVTEVFDKCEQIISQSSSLKKSVSQSVQIDGKDFVFSDPSQLSLNELGISNEEFKIAQQVLNKFKKAAQTQTQMLEGKISNLEKVLKQPYLDLKERPYYLHGILIHDGLAENGHYYSYIYERTSKRWWKMNDHRVEMESEENVMKEALGGSGYKSACNLFYISEHVKDIIEGYGKPTFLFTDYYGQKLGIPKNIITDIRRVNNNFDLQQQQFIVDQCVSRVHQQIKNRLQQLENQESNLNGVVDIKTNSLYHFLKIINFKGYGKWCIVNQVMKEEHPQQLSLSDIIVNNDTKQDEIYQQIIQKKYYTDQFLSLTQNEEKSLQIKQMMYREALKKAAAISFIMMNTGLSQIKQVIMSYAFMIEKIPELKQKYNQYEKISDYDTLVNEVIQVYFTRIMCYLVLNFNNKSQETRIRAYNCARICVAISSKYLDPEKNPHKQFMNSFTEIAQWYNKQKDLEKCLVERQEIKDVIELYNKFKSKQLQTSDKFALSYPESQISQDLQNSLEKIAMLDLNKHSDGIDTESISYRYCNSLAQFKNDFYIEIKIQNELVGKNKSVSLHEQLKHLNSLGLLQSKTFKNDMEDANFKIQDILGEQQNVQFIKT